MESEVKLKKITPYNIDNPLRWTEEDFRDVICTMVNIKFLTGDYITPLLNCYYLNESEQWKRDKLGLDKQWKKEYLQEQINNLQIELRELDDVRAEKE